MSRIKLGHSSDHQQQGTTMKKSLYARSAIVAALVMTIGTAMAQSDQTKLNYNFIGLGYGTSKVKTPDLSMNFHGSGIHGSYRFADQFFVTGEYFSAKANPMGISTKVSNSAIGLGYRYGLSANTDLTVELGYIDNKTKVANFSDKTSETVITGGIRTMLNQEFQLNTTVSSYKPDNGKSYTSYDLDLIYHLDKKWAVKASYGHQKDGDTTQNSLIASVGYKF
jgi:hypothetical protein